MQGMMKGKALFFPFNFSVPRNIICSFFSTQQEKNGLNNKESQEELLLIFCYVILQDLLEDADLCTRSEA